MRLSDSRENTSPVGLHGLHNTINFPFFGREVRWGRSLVCTSAPKALQWFDTEDKTHYEAQRHHAVLGQKQNRKSPDCAPAVTQESGSEK